MLALDIRTSVLLPDPSVVLTALCADEMQEPHFLNFRSLLAGTCGNAFLFSF